MRKTNGGGGLGGGLMKMIITVITINSNCLSCSRSTIRSKQ